MEKANCSISSAFSTLFSKEKNNILDGYTFTFDTNYNSENSNLISPIVVKEWELVNRNFEEVDFRYLTVKKDAATVLVAYFQVFELTYKNFNSPTTNSFFKQILKYFLDCKKVKVLFLGNVLRTNQTSYLNDHQLLSPQKAISLITACIDVLAKEENISATILKEIPDTESLELEGYSSPLQDIVMNMEILPQWNTFEDYQKSLSRKYVARAKKIRKYLQVLQVNQLTSQEIINHSHTIYNLFNQVLSNQILVMGSLKPEYFYELKTLHLDNFEFFNFTLDGEIIAFYSAFLTATTYEVYYLGFDNRLNLAYNLYFNILFSSLERAIKLRKSNITFGRTSLDAKANLGAKPTVLNSYIKLHNAPQWLLERFVTYFTSLESSQWKDRNPLKPEAENIVEVDAFL